MSETVLNSEIVRKPVNLIAARLLWPAPWWAKCEIKEKLELSKAVESQPESVVISYFTEPRECVEDRRGVRIMWPDGSAGIVTGFADIQRKSEHHSRIRARNGSVYDEFRTAVKCWWVFTCGRFTRVAWAQPSARHWRTFSELKRNGWDTDSYEVARWIRKFPNNTNLRIPGK